MALLDVKSLTKTFGGVVAVDDITFLVFEGQIKSIIGPNGAGKTTVFNLLSGCARPDKGSASFGGYDLTHTRSHKIAEMGLARTFQQSLIFEHMTVLENVMVARETQVRHGFLSYMLWLPSTRRTEITMREKAREALRMVGLDEREQVSAGDMPAGDRHLLEIARALATEPRIILLDEPAAGLNSAETEVLSTIIKKVRDQGITVLLVEHDMGLVMNISDEIIVLDNGEKIAEGPPLLIQEDERVIEAYLGTSENA